MRKGAMGRSGGRPPLPDIAEVGVEGKHEVVEGVAGVAAADDGLLQQHHLHRLQPVLEQLRQHPQCLSLLRSCAFLITT